MHQGRRWWLGGLVGAVVALGPEALWAASPEGAHGGLISLDKSLIVQLVNFLILLAILWRLLYRPFLAKMRSEEHTSELQSLAYLVCRLLLEKKKARHPLILLRNSIRAPRICPLYDADEIHIHAPTASSCNHATS